MRDSARGTRAGWQKPKFYDTLLAKDTGWLFSFAVARSDFLVKSNDIDGAAKLLLPTAQKVRERAFGGASPDNDWNLLATWVGTYRADLKATRPTSENSSLSFAIARDSSFNGRPGCFARTG